MPIDCLIFDFDGTLTDADRHAPAFHQATQEELATALHISSQAVYALWQDANAFFSNAAVETGWDNQGFIVAPVLADPYLRANAITRRILETHAGNASNGDVAAMVHEIHRASYERARPPFRDLAKPVLEKAILDNKCVVVVTNSDHQAVSKRINDLGLKQRDKILVRGGAQKFVIAPPSRPCDSFGNMPEVMRVDGLNRPILLKRGRYYDVLRDIWDHTGIAPSATLVSGDIFELDLAMPSSLGSHIHLVTRPSTLEHERRAALAAPRGGASPDLANVFDRIAGAASS